MRNDSSTNDRGRYARGAFLLLAIAFSLFAKSIFAQAVPGKKIPGQKSSAEADDSSQPDKIPGLVIADRLLIVDLSRARQFIAQQQYGDAALLLHGLLESPDDVAFPTDRTSRVELHNLHLEAERLLGEMPVAGLKSYENRYGTEASLLLKAAVEKHDIDLLTKTSNRFFHTEAGRQATYLLATMHLDRGRPLDAAVCFQRLRRTRSVSTQEWAMLAFQNAMAWFMADMPQSADSCLAELKMIKSGGTLRLGDRKVELPSDGRPSLKWLESLLGSSVKSEHSPARHWTMFRGNASRTATVAASRYLPKAAWKVSTSTWKVPVEQAPFSKGVMNVARQIEGLAESFHKAGLPAIPGTAPLNVDDVLLLRVLNKLQALDIATGKLKWQIQQTNTLEQVRRGEVPPLPGDSGSILDPMLLDRVFTNTTHGTLSADRELVFSLENLGFINPANNNRGNQSAHPLGLKPFNRMSAYSISTGKKKWNVGDEVGQSKGELSGHFFLGPPLPLAGRLYCLAEVNQQIRLLVLQSQTGKLLWSKSLLKADLDITQDQHRGQSGLSPSFADGVLVCPTGAGVVVAIDMATRRLNWSYRYRESEEGDPRTRQMRMMARARLAALRGDTSAKIKSPGHWLDSLPFIAGRHVIVTPRDSDELYCLNLSDGSLLWKMPRENHLYIGGASGGKLLVVGNRQIQSFDLGSGKPFWPQPTKIPFPSGRGILLGDQYSIPLSSAEIATVDLHNGKILSRVKCEDGIVPGNLLSCGGFVVSQGIDSLVRFKRPTASELKASR